MKAKAKAKPTPTRKSKAARKSKATRKAGAKGGANGKVPAQQTVSISGMVVVPNGTLCKAPKQPDTVSCGVCVLMMIDLMVTQGMGAFYRLNEQCNAPETTGPLPKGATELRSGKVHWTERRINTKRLEYACRLANPCETR